MHGPVHTLAQYRTLRSTLVGAYGTYAPEGSLLTSAMLRPQMQKHTISVQFVPGMRGFVFDFAVQLARHTRVRHVLTYRMLVPVLPTDIPYAGTATDILHAGTATDIPYAGTGQSWK
eukprot:3840194-Rhodomonas_salina.1